MRTAQSERLDERDPESGTAEHVRYTAYTRNPVAGVLQIVLPLLAGASIIVVPLVLAPSIAESHAGRLAVMVPGILTALFLERRMRARFLADAASRDSGERPE